MKEVGNVRGDRGIGDGGVRNELCVCVFITVLLVVHVRFSICQSAGVTLWGCEHGPM